MKATWKTLQHGMYVLNALCTAFIIEIRHVSPDLLTTFHHQIFNLPLTIILALTTPINFFYHTYHYKFVMLFIFLRLEEKKKKMGRVFE